MLTALVDFDRAASRQEGHYEGKAQVAVAALGATPACGAARGGEQLTSLDALMKRLATAWSAQDTELALSCFTEDVVYMQPPDQQLYIGHGDLRALFGGLKPGTFMTFHHLAFDRRTQVGLGEFSFGREGRATAVHGVVVVRVRDGRIASWREYFIEGPAAFADFIATEGKTWRWTGQTLTR